MFKFTTTMNQNFVDDKECVKILRKDAKTSLAALYTMADSIRARQHYRTVDAYIVFLEEYVKALLKCPEKCN